MRVDAGAGLALLLLHILADADVEECFLDVVAGSGAVAGEVALVLADDALGLGWVGALVLEVGVVAPETGGTHTVFGRLGLVLVDGNRVGRARRLRWAVTRCAIGFMGRLVILVLDGVGPELVE